MKKEGITLIALVITIVVILLLAAVSINAIIGENGIIESAKESTKIYENATKNELQFLNQLNNEMAGWNTKLEISEGDIEFLCSETNYTNQNVEVTIKAKEKSGATVKYQIENKTEWLSYQTPIILEENAKLFAKYVRDEEETNTVQFEVSNIDKLAPSNPQIEIAKTENSISIQAKSEDAENTPQYAKSEIEGYRFSIDNGTNWTPWQETGKYEYQNLEAGVYLVKIQVKDKAQNSSESEQKVGLKLYFIQSGLGGTYNQTAYTSNFRSSLGNGDGKSSGSLTNKGAYLQSYFRNPTATGGPTFSFSFAISNIDWSAYQSIFIRYHMHGSTPYPKNGHFTLRVGSWTVFDQWFAASQSSLNTGVVTQSHSVEGWTGTATVSTGLSGAGGTHYIDLYDVWVE